MLQTSSRVSFSSLRGQQLEPPSLPCRDPGKASRAVCAKGNHAAPDSLGDKHLNGHRVLASGQHRLLCD